MILEEDLTFNARVEKIALATTEDDAPAGGVALVTGWGAMHENDKDIPDDLQELYVKIFSQEECKGFYKDRVNEHMLCAGFPEGGKDSCQGDSGGPLVKNGKQIGVVSWGIGCARPNRPGIYSNVANLHEWVENKMNEYSN